MKATISYNLPEEQSDFDTAIKASQVQSGLFELDNDLRNYLKHGSMLPAVDYVPDPGAHAQSMAQYVRARLSHLISRD